MVILVDENDNAIGTMHKLEAHRKGLLHRAFSIFIFNTDGKLLLQRRAESKYHSGGLWTNTCCSHPSPHEDTLEAARKRLKFEMGMDAPIQYILKFTYKSPYDNQLTEHEIDHIFIGETDDVPVINPDEVSDYKYMFIPDVVTDMQQHPENYTTWFQIIFDQFLSNISLYLRKEFV